MYSVNFANTGNPTIPYNSKSHLSSVDWKSWNSCSNHPLLTFLDPALNVSITYDTYKVAHWRLVLASFLPAMLHYAIISSLVNEVIKI